MPEDTAIDETTQPTPVHHEVHIADQLDTIHDTLSFQGRHGQPGARKPHIVVKAGDSLSHRLQAWVRRDQRVDREANQYDEVVTAEDGTILHERHEPLDEHQGHGSAKPKS